VFECVPPTDAQFPKYSTRRKIDTQVSKTAREHIIIFHDLAKTVQVWQWVKRESGKSSACREQLFYTRQSGDALIQKIQRIAFVLEDEANITETVGRVGTAFDVEKVTKKFYELFKKEHDAFLKFTKGIPDGKLQRWYASVMLNRLMFIYFVQKKGFLGGDQQYLTNKLTESKRRGKDKFYREFLCLLFFEGFAKREEQRSAEMNTLLGRVPYLNGGLFLKHQIEELCGKTIAVPDRAFEQIFDFFEQYDWHLDDRPTRTGREINPDVLGYVFEKYINQKDMGAYYTKEDITAYISKNTIIPALFDMARKSCRIAFEGEHSVWRLLQADPDRYIHAAMLKGTDKDLPQHIAAALKDVSKRGDWNKPAELEYALPTETWREALARRARSDEVRGKLAAYEIRSINDLITYNLDILRFAEEVIANAEGPELLRAFYKAVRSVSVLDPACGSGAFLFAALNILEQLYDTCLVRMQAFVDDLDRSGQKHSPEKFKDFRETLQQMNDKTRHPSPRYFILKSIILNNLYGVDMMEEATEICKLRLFLKLVAQVDPGDKIEPLPDIDFNIRAGNTLVGYATDEELDKALNRLGHGEKKTEIAEKADLARMAFERFRQEQVVGGMGSPEELAGWKADVHRRLGELRDELDDYLAGDYNIKKGDKANFSHWRESHQPFHWFVEFYGIMRQGGFDAVIGNPPWREYSAVKKAYGIRNYLTEKAGNLYALFIERCLVLRSREGGFSFIVQLPLTSSSRMEATREVLRIHSKYLYVATFGDRPGKLFEGMEHCRAAIFSSLRHPSDAESVSLYCTKYHRWPSAARGQLFSTLEFVP
ncbi:MAG: DNA methyltransferase, partial [Candidatus Angelobacter sp.]